MSRATRTAELLAAAGLVPLEIAREQEKTRRASATSQALASLVPALIQGGVDIYGAVGKEQRAQDLLGLQEKKIDAGITAAASKGATAQDIQQQRADNEAARIKLAREKADAEAAKAAVTAGEKANKNAQALIGLGAGREAAMLPSTDAPAERKLVATFAPGTSPLDQIEDVKKKTGTGLTIEELGATVDKAQQEAMNSENIAKKREADAVIAANKAADAEAFTPEQRKNAQADALRKEFLARKPVLKAEGSRAAFDDLRTLVEQNPSAGADLAIVYSFMHTLDPGSVVKDTEFDAAARAAGVGDRLLGYLDKALSGQFLTPEQRQDLLAQGRVLAESNQRAAEQVRQQYGQLAQRAGFNPVDVIGGPMQATPAPGAPKPPPTPAEKADADKAAEQFGARKQK